MSKTLIIYNFFSLGRNSDFFMRNGVQNRSDVDYIFVCNNVDIDLESTWLDLFSYPNVEYYTRENSGYDYAAYSFALFHSKRGYRKIMKEYDYFIFINESVLGPFLPLWWKPISQGEHWSKIFTNLINEETKLAGTTINYHKGHPHVQGHFLTTDKVGLDIGISKSIFENSVRIVDKQEIIELKEVKYSTDIIHAGYNIGSLLTAFDDVDFREPHKNYDGQDCPCSKNSYFGTTIQPYEVIFHKTNRNIDDALVNKLIEWEDRSAPDMFMLS